LAAVANVERGRQKHYGAVRQVGCGGARKKKITPLLLSLWKRTESADIMLLATTRRMPASTSFGRKSMVVFWAE
jgi:hypothetical protein